MYRDSTRGLGKCSPTHSVTIEYAPQSRSAPTERETPNFVTALGDGLSCHGLATAERAMLRDVYEVTGLPQFTG